MFTLPLCCVDACLSFLTGLNRLSNDTRLIYSSCFCDVIVPGIVFVSADISYGQSSSDLEALHQAYCHIAHSLGDADGQRTESNTMEIIKSSVNDHPQENEESSKHVSTTESGKNR